MGGCPTGTCLEEEPAAPEGWEDFLRPEALRLEESLGTSAPWGVHWVGSWGPSPSGLPAASGKHAHPALGSRMQKWLQRGTRGLGQASGTTRVSRKTDVSLRMGWAGHASGARTPVKEQPQSPGERAATWTDEPSPGTGRADGAEPADVGAARGAGGQGRPEASPEQGRGRGLLGPGGPVEGRRRLGPPRRGRQHVCDGSEGTATVTPGAQGGGVRGLTRRPHVGPPLQDVLLTIRRENWER